MPKLSNKRERLVDAAKALFHDRGYANTSLSDIASLSEVPLGNVYYYFKTKEDLGAAVIISRKDDFTDLTKTLNRIHDAKKRLIQFFEIVEKKVDIFTKKGCPVGSLCQELNKDRSNLSEMADSILLAQLDWFKGQLQQLAVKDPESLANHIVISLQGAILLSNASASSEILIKEIQRLKGIVGQ